MRETMEFMYYSLLLESTAAPYLHPLYFHSTSTHTYTNIEQIQNTKKVTSS